MLYEHREKKNSKRKLAIIGSIFIMLLFSVGGPLALGLLETPSDSGTVAVEGPATELPDVSESETEEECTDCESEEFEEIEMLDQSKEMDVFNDDHPMTEASLGPPVTLAGSNTVFGYDGHSDGSLDLGTESGFLGTQESEIIVMEGKGPSNKSKGGKLGNAPDALYRVLEKFLAKGKAPPPNFPVPYVVYTRSDGDVEIITDVLTKQPSMIDVDDSQATGQGRKDIKVKTTIDVDPLTITTEITRLGDPNPAFLQVYVTFPAFFYNGEAGDPNGEPYWMFGYTTEPGSEIPEDITMTFSVDRTLGAEHAFDFDWTSDSGIDPLKFTMGIFQVQDRDLSAPIFPAFAEFIVSSPPNAGLTFTTAETATVSLKCMNWTAPAAFNLAFGFSEQEILSGSNVSFNATIDVDSVPQSFSVCTQEDRGANTYTVDYTANAQVDEFNITTDIDIDGTSAININALILNMPAAFHAVFGDGYLDVDVQSNVGFVGLNATASIGMMAVPIYANISLMIWDIPDFNATWFQDSNGNGFALDAPSCIGEIQLAFSLGALMYPAEHDSDPDSHYMFAFSDPTTVSITLRLIGPSHLGFYQNSNIALTGFDGEFCDNNILYILANTALGSILTPDHVLVLDVEVDETPTDIGVNWTVPFTLNLTTNDPIAHIWADLIYDNLTAHAEIHDIPANMSWHIDPSSSIVFDADSSIGTVWIRAHDPFGLPGAQTFFAGDPARLFDVIAHDVAPFTAGFMTDDSIDWTGISFNTAPMTALGDLSFALTTSNLTWVTLLGAEENRALFYNNDTRDLGNGFVMEASLWLHVEDVTRAEFGYGGNVTTIDIGFGAAQANELRVGLEIGNKSDYNPIQDNVTALVVTTPLPTSMDVTIVPEESFDYTASSEILLITVDAAIGTTVAHIEIEGIPTTADGNWDIANPGSFQLNLGDRLDRIWTVMDDATGISTSDLRHVDVLILDVPESVRATWNLNNQSAVLNFLDGTYDEGLGEFRFLATTGDQIPTENFMNGLSTVYSCLTDYSAYSETIDDRYWPNTVPSRLDALYCRAPSLDTGADDYAVFREGNMTVDEPDVYSVRVREIGLMNFKLTNDDGFVLLEFSRNLALNRQLYFISDDYDNDKMTLGEVSRLPDGLALNRIRAEWDVSGNHYEYQLTEPIAYIDAYMGPHNTQSQTNKYTKLVLADVPSSVEIDYNFGSTAGFFDFVASDVWEAGILYQKSGKRYVGWIQMQSLHFDYSYALPGTESCSFGMDFEFCYRIFRLDATLDAYPGDADGIFGIYDRMSGPETLIGGGPAPGANEYVPDWAFILKDFDIVDIHVLWDVGAGIDIDPLSVDVKVFPHVAIEADFQIQVDYFWNDQKVMSGGIDNFPFPLLPLPCVLTDFSASLTINSVKDYRDQNPIHLWPWHGPDSPVIFGWNSGWSKGPTFEKPCRDFVLFVDVVVDVPGFHRFHDHLTPFV